MNEKNISKYIHMINRPLIKMGGLFRNSKYVFFKIFYSNLAVFLNQRFNHFSHTDLR